MAHTTRGPLEAGGSALLRAAWTEAGRHFEAALAEGETTEALAGLGASARGLLDERRALAAHERGYRLARELGDDRAAVHLALELALDFMAFRGMAEANGWLERAEQLLERIPEPSADLGLYLYCRANYALKVDHDPRSAADFASSSVALARLGGAVDGEMASLALEGLALVAAGRVGEGMRRLDQATAAAVVGEISDVRLVEVVCCHLIDACKRVRDFDRAGEWCRRVQEISERYDDAEMFATCRTEYADLLIWQDAWADAEDVLRAACRELGRVPRREADGLVKLAELRRRQRRIREALALLDEAGGHRHAALVRAAIALDGGDPPAAAEHAERFLRRAGGEDTFERVPALELLFKALAARPEEADRFPGVITGAVPMSDYFTPQNLMRVLGLRGMISLALSRARPRRRSAGGELAAVSAR